MTYDENLPQICWDEEKALWKHKNHIPAALQNDDLEEAKKKSEEDLFDGYTLMAYQKVEVNLKERKTTLLNEYKWSYIE